MKKTISSLFIGILALALGCALTGCETTPQKLPDEKVNSVEYTEYYGGHYIDNVKIVVLLTEMNEDFISFCKNYVGENASYELCEVSLAELKTVYATITDFLMKYEESDDNDLNELAHSIVTGGTDVMENRVVISIIDCTDEKIALFKKHIVDSEYILFENTDDYVELQ